jgi:hypothetical protein
MARLAQRLVHRFRPPPFRAVVMPDACSVPYRRSKALLRWSGSRRAAIRAVQHARLADERLLAQAYVVRVVTEFQAFVRDLHDLGARHLVVLARPDADRRVLLVDAAVHGRTIDRGNPAVRNLVTDFVALGISNLDERLNRASPRWRSTPGQRGDRAAYGDLLELRNAVAHGNERQLNQLRERRVHDTVTWVRQQLPGLDRTARALDHILWDHLLSIYAEEPW